MALGCSDSHTFLAGFDRPRTAGKQKFKSSSAWTALGQPLFHVLIGPFDDLAQLDRLLLRRLVGGIL